MQTFFQHLYKLVQRLIFVWVRIPENQHHTDLARLQAAKHVIFVLEQDSWADALAVDHELKKYQLPSLFQIRQLDADVSAPSMMSAYRKQRWLRNKETSIDKAMTPLLNYVAQTKEDILIVPVLLYWGRAANTDKGILSAFFSSNWRVVGPFKKFLTLLFNGRDTYLEVRDPISLQAALAEDDRPLAVKSRKVARLLRVHFRQARTAIIGPDLSHRRVMIDSLLNTTPVHKAIQSHATSKKQPLEKSRKLAAKHARNIAADVSYGTIRILDILLTRLWNKIYNGIHIQGIQQIRDIANAHEIVYVPCHRSHIDYLLLSYCLHRNGLNIPHIAAGENLNMPVVGSILRRGGAFFIRRKFGGDKLYTTIFNEYMHTVFKRGYPVEYFIEGGRSRTGRMRDPATGTLAMTVRSHLRDHSRPIALIPVYIGYEKVFEARSYLGELRGKEKKKENLFDLLKTVRQLKNYGRVYLNFGQPIKLNEQLQQSQSDWNSQQYGPDDKPAWMFNFVDKLATQTITEINNAAALNPINLVALVLLTTPRFTIERSLLIKQLGFLHQLQHKQPYSEHMSLADGDPEKWIRHATALRAMKVVPQSLGDLYTLDAKNAVLMSYYRNNVQHLYAIPSIVSAFIVQSGKVSRDVITRRIKLIYPYIKAELFLRFDESEIDQQVTGALQTLLELKLVSEMDSGEIIAPTKTATAHVQITMLGNLMLPTLERYLITLSVLANLPTGKHNQAELERQAQQFAERLALLNGLDAPEFFDKALFKKFIQTMKLRKLIWINAAGHIEYDERIAESIAEFSTVMPEDIWYNVLQTTQID